MLHDQALIGVNRGQVGELGTLRPLFRSLPVNRDELLNRSELLVLACGARLAAYHVALAQSVATDHRKTHVGIRLAGKVSLRAQEAVPIGHNIENAGDLDESFGFYARLVDRIDKLRLLKAGRIQLELGSLRPQFSDLERCKFLAVHARSDLSVLLVAAPTLLAIVAVLLLVLLLIVVAIFVVTGMILSGLLLLV